MPNLACAIVFVCLTWIISKFLGTEVKKEDGNGILILHLFIIVALLIMWVSAFRGIIR